MKTLSKKRIIVSVTNDLVSDNRVHKVCSTLTDMGFDVLLAGRKLPGSPVLANRSYRTKRFRLLFNKGPLFYACYNFRLLCFLLFSKFELLLSNDLDTLPANFVASKIKKKPLVYDSHEYFTEVPELINRPVVKRIWEWLEQKMVPKLEHAYTVCESVARIYTEKYGVRFRVVRNVPLAFKAEQGRTGIENFSGKVILYQGAVNTGRGLEQAIRAMKFMEGARLVIAGHGDLREKMEELVKEAGVENSVQFLGRLPIEDLVRLTPRAHMGLSIEEDRGLNYHYTLPNKLFDYIQAQVPVLVTDLPEMAAVVRKYNVGEITDSLEPQKLAQKFKTVLFDENKRKVWCKNLKKAARELIWENEEKTLKEIYFPFL